ncbi:hypothetical protein CEUSTIGMA_g12176.t1, partial [Chlamydomonas eustigma]
DGELVALGAVHHLQHRCGPRVGAQKPVPELVDGHRRVRRRRQAQTRATAHLVVQVDPGAANLQVADQQTVRRAVLLELGQHRPAMGRGCVALQRERFKRGHLGVREEEADAVSVVKVRQL